MIISSFCLVKFKLNFLNNVQNNFGIGNNTGSAW